MCFGGAAGAQPGGFGIGTQSGNQPPPAPGSAAPAPVALPPARPATAGATVAPGSAAPAPAPSYAGVAADEAQRSPALPYKLYHGPDYSGVTADERQRSPDLPYLLRPPKDAETLDTGTTVNTERYARRKRAQTLMEA